MRTITFLIAFEVGMPIMKFLLMSPLLYKEEMGTRMVTGIIHALYLLPIEGKADQELQIRPQVDILTTTPRTLLTRRILLIIKLSL